MDCRFKSIFKYHIVLLIFILVSCNNLDPDIFAESIKTGDIKTVKLYIKKGFDVNQRINWEYPVFIAIKNEQYEILELLSQNGAEVSKIQDSKGNAPLIFAIESNNVELFNVLIKFGADIENSLSIKKENPLLFAYNNNKTIFLEKLILSGANYNIKDNNKFPISFRFALNGPLSLFEICLDKGFNVNFSSSSGFTLLHLVNSNDNYDLLKLLISSGADLNVKDKNGDTPLKKAFIKGDVTKALLLINHGAELYYDESFDGMIWLDLKQNWKEGYSEIADLVLNKGVKLNVSDSPIFLTGASYDYTEWLLQHGMNPTIPNEDGTLPLDYLDRSYQSADGYEVSDEVLSEIYWIKSLLIEYMAKF